MNVTAWDIWFLMQAVMGCPFLSWSGMSWQAHQRFQKTSAFQLARSPVLSYTQFVIRGMPCNIAQSSYKALAAIRFQKSHSFLCCSSPMIGYTQYVPNQLSMISLLLISLDFRFSVWEARPVNNVLQNETWLLVTIFLHWNQQRSLLNSLSLNQSSKAFQQFVNLAI